MKEVLKKDLKMAMEHKNIALGILIKENLSGALKRELEYILIKMGISMMVNLTMT